MENTTLAQAIKCEFLVEHPAAWIFPVFSYDEQNYDINQNCFKLKRKYEFTVS